MTVRLFQPMTRFTQLYQTSEWLTGHPLLCPVLLPAAWFPPWVLTSARELHDYLHLRRSEPFRSAGGGGTRKFNSGRKTISTSVTSHSVRSPFCPGKQAAPFFSGAIRKKAQSVSSCVTRLVPRLVLCQLQFSRCWRGHLTLILSVTMFSNYHSLHTNMIAWLAVLFPWQLLWFWLCQSLRSLLRVASNSGSPSRSLFLFFYFPSCVGWLFEVYSLFFTVEKLFKNSCPAPLQCYYLWAQ